MSSVSSVLPQLLIPLAVLIVFALLRKYLPAPRTSKLPKHFSVEDLDFRFRRTKWIVGVAMPLVAGVFFWLTYKYLVSLSLSFAVNDGPASFQLLPSSAIWWFFPGFGAVALCWEITLFFWSLFGNRETIAKYILWSNVRAGFNTTKALRWLALVIVLPIGVLTLLAVPMHSTLRSDEMRIREFASLSSSRYRYSDVRRLAVVRGFRDRDGKFTASSQVIVKFADGRQWSFADNRDPEPQVDQSFVSFLAQKTQLPVEYAEVAADLSPPL